MPIYKIRGINVDFPYDAYDCQVIYMEKVIQCLQEGCNALLESPTGTRKTLCLLCATLAWRKTLGDFSLKVDEGKSYFSGSQLSDSQSTEIPESKFPVIIYCSRTHSQLKQVILELKATNYRPRMGILGSREQMCIHDNVRQLPVRLQNDACRILCKWRGCRPHRNVSEFMKNHQDIGNDPFDIEDLVKIGRKKDACPYYITRELHKVVDILFAPYNDLIDPGNRSSLSGISWSNSVLIFDEAHNLDVICADAASFDVPSGYVTACIAKAKECINLCIEKRALERAADKRHDPETYSILTELEIVSARNPKKIKATTWYQDPGVHRITDVQARERKIVGQDVVDLHLTNRDATSELEIVPARNPKRIKSTTWYQDPGVHRITDVQVRERKIVSQDVVDLHLTNRDATSGAIIKTMLREIHESQEPQRIAAFAGSAIAACFRDLGPVLISAFEDTIGRVNIIDDTNRIGFAFELEEPDSSSQTYMHVAQIILIMFKNIINQNSYERFLIRIIKALKAIVGLPDDEQVNIVMPIEKAMMVRARLGSYHPIKKKILEILIVHREIKTTLGAMSNYLCNLLEWHEMTSVLFIFQTIAVTKSPVLLDLRISSDVLNFLEAAKAIHSSSHYGYFRILETNQFKRGLVERSRFPLLSAVAQRIVSQTLGSAINYQGTPGEIPPVVNLLVEKHNHYIAGAQPDLHRKKLQLLRHYTDEEEA